MGNNGIVLVVGKGSIIIHPKQGKKKEIKNIYFTLAIKHNLMGVRHIIQNGYKVLIDKNEYVIFNKDESKKFVMAFKITKN